MENVGFEEEEEDIDEEEIEDDEEDEFESVFSNIPRGEALTGFTFSEMAPERQFTPAEKKLHITNKALKYGVPFDKTVSLRFILGPKEHNKFPGKGPGEVDKYKRKWIELYEFSRHHNWRRILSNGFTGNKWAPIHVRGGKAKPTEDVYGDDAMSFIIDKIEWKTITHYMIGMMYFETEPQYSIMFSMSSKNLESGFWDDVESALKEHRKNVQFGDHKIDMNFEAKAESYMTKGLFAKFTQNPVAKKALLLTQDAVLAVRSKPEGVLDFHLLMKVRDAILKNKTMIYKGDTVPVEYIESEDEKLITMEELNHGYLKSKDGVNMVAGSVQSTSIYKHRSLFEIIENIGLDFIVEPEDITTHDCYMYMTTGSFNFNLRDLIKNYGLPKLVKRHVYGFELVAYDLKTQIMIGLQRTPSSIVSEYIMFNISLEPNSKFPIPLSVYLEPLSSGFGIFIIASEKNAKILDYFKAGIAARELVSP